MEKENNVIFNAYELYSLTAAHLFYRTREKYGNRLRVDLRQRYQKKQTATPRKIKEPASTNKASKMNPNVTVVDSPQDGRSIGYLMAALAALSEAS